MGGEAKRRAKARALALTQCKTITRSRFNAFAIGTRLSGAHYVADELSWWASNDERLIGLVNRDRVDGDFGWVLLARDKIGRFRCVRVDVSYSSARRAEDSLLQEIYRVIHTGEVATIGDQADETNAPIELLRLPTECDPNTLHPYFRQLLETPAREPARAIIREIGPWLTPNDPHLVQEFQTRGFDQRLWEIYLWAAFREFGLDIAQHEAPDFRCTGPGIDFTVEATTVAPSDKGALAEHPNPKTREETVDFLDNYMAMKFGSALHSKLTKKNAQGFHYWEREVSRGKPFALAVADFHKPASANEPASLTYTQSSLWQYLYGHRVYWRFEGDELIMERRDIGEHEYSGKKVPSGFFDLPLAKHVSAVIFSNAGTLAKFDRMGVVAGFAAPGVTYMRVGLKYNPDPKAVMGLPFAINIEESTYQEHWTDELQVFHNPSAELPIPFDWLPGAIHHHLKDGMLQSLMPDDAVLSSITHLLTAQSS